MTPEETYQLKQFTPIFAYNTQYLYYDNDGKGIYLLDHRKDYDHFLYLSERDFTFISLRKNKAKIVMEMDRLIGNDKLVMEIYTI